MSSYRVNKKVYRDRLKDIRPFVKFDYNLNEPLSRYAKKKITNYHKEISRLKARPTYIYRPRNPSKLKAAQNYGQHEIELSDLKVAFIPSTMPMKIKVTKTGRVKVNYFQDAEKKHASPVTEKYLPFDKQKFARNPLNETNRVIKQEPDAKRFFIQAGRYQMKFSVTRAVIADKVNELAAIYNNPKKNNYRGNWLNGVIAVKYKGESNFDEYKRARNTAREKLRQERERDYQKSKKQGQREKMVNSYKKSNRKYYKK